MSYRIADLKEGFGTIQVTGFKLKKGSGSFLWERKTNEFRQEIAAPIKKGSDNFRCRGIIATTTFLALEKRLREVFELVNVDADQPLGIIVSCSETEGIDDSSLFDLPIRDQISFGKVRVALEQAILTGALPFFEKFSSFEKAATVFATLSFQESVGFFFGRQAYLVPIFILLVTKHPAYESKRNEFYAVLKEDSIESPGLKNILLAFELLFVNQ